MAVGTKRSGRSFLVLVLVPRLLLLPQYGWRRRGFRANAQCLISGRVVSNTQRQIAYHVLGKHEQEAHQRIREL